MRFRWTRSRNWEMTLLYKTVSSSLFLFCGGILSILFTSDVRVNSSLFSGICSYKTPPRHLWSALRSRRSRYLYWQLLEQKRNLSKVFVSRRSRPERLLLPHIKDGCNMSWTRNTGHCGRRRAIGCFQDRTADFPLSEGNSDP
jgi:hypothetical protein